MVSYFGEEPGPCLPILLLNVLLRRAGETRRQDDPSQPAIWSGGLSVKALRRSVCQLIFVWWCDRGALRRSQVGPGLCFPPSPSPSPSPSRRLQPFRRGRSPGWAVFWNGHQRIVLPSLPANRASANLITTYLCTVTTGRLTAPIPGAESMPIFSPTSQKITPT
ncbi:uncharacterized protein BO95DRAFT_100423 [Aspergillus brunneoviolaceus CBS 621.78]|uniref:Uncharacterized protein n=1 Tax=Aspergillus brunneoviolaceus CBS 621.78 TaxID=1450534 RepID=A0ACD1GC36_9EURO|nr:hypothetical protein BO95DRAFT_100423 [Aspergillus brunneoviolaceus CBS 621.78]RAH46681.1 hypothetical protein BO95DRAFT_100423 [Aspergillus brunneoviolaceus CBS 621.78]